MRFFYLLSILACAALLACGDRETPVRAELDRLGIAYTAAAFIDAARAGNLEVVKLFVEAGMDIDATNNYGVNGVTALHWAAWDGHLSVVEYLVGQGASLTATDNHGKMAKDIASYWGHADIVDYLESVGG